MTASFWQNYGLSINVYKPTISGAPTPLTYTPAGTLVSVISDNIDAYQHVIQAQAFSSTSPNRTLRIGLTPGSAVISRYMTTPSLSFGRGLPIAYRPTWGRSHW
jgi:hypothetical protein